MDSKDRVHALLMVKTFEQEVKQGERFRFGRNWKRYLTVLNDDRIAQAEQSLRDLLGRDNLQGRTFLDIGCGSGLFSLAARRLGATVHSVDFDPDSVACSVELKQRYLPDDSDWKVEVGSAVDAEYLQSLGKFDIVYSWGVLHHTGAMWQALENAAIPVAEQGRLIVAVYNDQGGRSRTWRRVKRFYCSGVAGKACVTAVFIPGFILGSLLTDLMKARSPISRYRKQPRGMSQVHDWIDWLGGYPFEVAGSDEIVEFYRSKGFELEKLVTRGGGSGNNEFVFIKP